MDPIDRDDTIIFRNGSNFIYINIYTTSSELEPGEFYIFKNNNFKKFWINDEDFEYSNREAILEYHNYI